MSSSETRFPFYNTELSLEERVNDLVQRLTLDEKAGQLSHQSPAIPRLGIPYYNWLSEALHGLARAGRATVFPQSIGLGATFDRELMKGIGAAVGDETRAKHHAAVAKGNRAQYLGLTIMSPTVNIFRDPRWGRGQETFGEDPYLTGVLGSAYVQGLQGDDPTYLKVAAYAKHFAVHSGPEEGRYSFNACVSPKDLYETYLAAFKMLVDSGVEGIMGAYNAVNGEPCCASPTLLRDILRGQWGFRGSVITDGGGVHFLKEGHRAAATMEAAAASALNNGSDIELGPVFARYLARAVREGLVSEETLDNALRRAFRTRFRLGMFDPAESVPYTSIPASVVGCEAHRKLAYEAAVRSIVLLKNGDGCLPMPADVRSIFLCGPNATSVEALLGSYYGQNARLTTLLEGLAGTVDEGTCLTYARLCPVAGGTLKKKGAKMDNGEPYEYVVAAMGLSPLYEGESGGDPEDSPYDGDRRELDLPGNQLELLKAVKSSGRKLVVVVFGGSPLNLKWVMENADAVLYAFYPGEAGGEAIADILFGKLVPSGRMPFTCLESSEELPDYHSYSMVNRTYRYMIGEPLIPFGFGLSYTTFTYEGLELDRDSVGPGEHLTLRLTVRNTGLVAGEDVIQLYLSHDVPSLPPPRYSLKNFTRIKLEPGARGTVTLALSDQELSVVRDDGTVGFEPGTVTLTVGGCSPGNVGYSLGASKAVSATLHMHA